MMNTIGYKPPYVGVSGVVSSEEQLQLTESARELGLFNTGRRLALGVKAVHKTQFLDVPNKYGPEWYPVGGQNFAKTLDADRLNADVFGVAQVYLDVDHVSDAGYRDAFTTRIAQRGKAWLRAMQFDLLPWHSDPAMPKFIEEIRRRHEVEIFFQCHKDAMSELGPKGVVRKLGEFAGLVDYVLYDASHGTGTRLDVNALRPFVDEAYSGLDTDQVGIAIAGGLNATIVREDLPVLASQYPDLSWDAEGQLHLKRQDGTRPLHMDIVRDYLKSSADLLK